MTVALAAELDAAREQLWELLREYLTAYAGRRPVRKVAMVGNAPLAPDAQRAAEIDSCDLVIRANSMVLDEPGQPPCVGTACHAVILSHATATTPWVFRDYRSRAYLVPQAGMPRNPRPIPAVPFWPADLGAMPLPNAIVKQRLADLMDPQHVPGELTPTTGMMGTYLAHALFPGAETIVTGLSFLDGAPRRSWDHHAGGSTDINYWHDLALEGALLRRWIDEGTLRFLH
ncbi:MAG TPA: hypothetical protein VHC23_03890 [Jatrophihabitans sp.]|jgi:hypothetical protein|nr:hypothetical protein [Jatrophihabitans sp.]